MSDARQPLDLMTPVQFLKGVGPQRTALLEKLDLRTACDILFFFPRDYETLAEAKAVNELKEGAPCRLAGVIEEVDFQTTSSGCVFGMLVRQEGQHVRAIWFNQPNIRNRFFRGMRVMLSGSPRLQGGRWEFAHPRVEPLADLDELPGARLEPIYPLTAGLNQAQMRRIVRSVVEKFAETLDEVFPDDFLAQRQLWPIRKALPQIHWPENDEGLQQARRRFIYQELFVLQLALAMRRQRLTVGRSAPALPATAQIDARIVRLFPYELTVGQRQVIDEIAADMAQEHPMSRLLQGDVGSGKTAVAAYAMLVAVAHKHQAALMAPTEILARQHEATLRELLSQSRVRIGLLVGSMTPAERRRLLERVAAGEIDLLIGTHALIQNDVQFAKLGLVVIDEQHKFGVRQRAALRQSGADPHYLVMTATPIPRTISMTLFGDLAVSTLRDSPPGRQPVRSYLATPEQRAKWWDFFRRKLREGRQGYVVAPLVDESDSVAAASVQQLFESLAHGELEAFRLDLLHGRQEPRLKQAAMDAFRQGKTQVLVATSVVEVGVDVPNATLMTIEAGERFGLAQLHQLRGRIGRGKHPGCLCVFADQTSEDSRQRLEAFVGTTDGFRLAEIDFALRGPGDLLGARQHGLPPLRIADLLRDAEVLEEARRDAQDLVANDPRLENPLYARLRRMTLARYGQSLELGDAG